jgi:dTDP-4-dehydrorhamnose 3,5-epimerase
MQSLPTSIPEVIVLTPPVFTDSRGYFLETYQQKKYAELGIPKPFVQDNQSYSTKNVLRGLHFQLRYPQGKLVRVTQGTVFDVAVDIRRNSPTFGKWHGEILSAENKKQMYIPENFAHGFCVLSDSAEFLYKCTDFYVPGDEAGLIWNDSQIGIKWPISEPILSAKDADLPSLEDSLSLVTGSQNRAGVYCYLEQSWRDAGLVWDTHW